MSFVRYTLKILNIIRFNMNKYYNVTLKEVTSSLKIISFNKLFIKVDKKSFIQITVLAFISGFIPPLLLL